MIQSLVSIVIPNFNSELYIKETIDSIKKQSYKNWECIIVDDHSTDNSYKIIGKQILNDKRFRLIKRPNNLIKGGNACRNYGFTLAKGKYINWFDSDDVMLPNFVELKTNKLEENKNLEFTISGGYFTDEYLNNRKEMQIIETENLYEDYFLWNMKIITNSIMFKKVFLNDKELFSNKIKKGQEFEFFTRLFFKIKPKQYYIIKESLFLYRVHKNSITHQNQKYNFGYKESEAYSLNKNLKRALLINNKKVAQSAYRLLINLFNKSLKNKHNYNQKFILKSLSEAGIKNSFLIKMFLNIAIKLNNLVNITNTKWEKVIKKIPII